MNYEFIFNFNIYLLNLAGVRSPGKKPLKSSKKAPKKAPRTQSYKNVGLPTHNPQKAVFSGIKNPIFRIFFVRWAAFLRLFLRREITKKARAFFQVT